MSTPVRTATEIAAEIAALTKLLPRIPASGMCGNNHDAIRAQIETLEQLRDEDEVHAQYDETCEEFEADAGYERDNALDAARWLAGTDAEACSAAWMDLAK